MKNIKDLEKYCESLTIDHSKLIEEADNWRAVYLKGHPSVSGIDYNDIVREDSKYQRLIEKTMDVSQKVMTTKDIIDCILSDTVIRSYTLDQFAGFCEDEDLVDFVQSVAG